MIEGLRTRIRALESEPARFLADAPEKKLCNGEASDHSCDSYPRPAISSSGLPPSVADAGAWTLGETAFDARLPEGCLNPAALIELKPAAHGDWPAALAFAACLAVRRRLGESTLGDGRMLQGPLLWCATPPFLSEHGRLYGKGLADIGLAPDGLIAVEAPREADALWVLEEGLRSRALSLAIGVLKGVDPTPSRRLGLAAAAGETPALLLTLPESAPAPTAWLRLRLSRMPGAVNPLDAQAPGPSRFRLVLERCRGAPLAETLSIDLEWCDVTYRFRLATALANRADEPAGLWRRARA